MNESDAIRHAEAICDELRISKKWNAPKLVAYLRKNLEVPGER